MSARLESYPLILDVLLLAVFQDLDEVALFIEKNANQTVWGRTSRAKTLPRDLSAAIEDIVAEFPAVLSGPPWSISDETPIKYFIGGKA